jgi:hypothetical protein
LGKYLVKLVPEHVQRQQRIKRANVVDGNTSDGCQSTEENQIANFWAPKPCDVWAEEKVRRLVVDRVFVANVERAKGQVHKTQDELKGLAVVAARVSFIEQHKCLARDLELTTPGLVLRLAVKQSCCASPCRLGNEKDRTERDDHFHEAHESTAQTHFAKVHGDERQRQEGTGFDVELRVDDRVGIVEDALVKT